MDPEIVIVREGSAYRVLFGHLRLAGAFWMANETEVDVKGEGKVKVVKMPGGLFVKHKNGNLPFLYS